MTCRCGCPENAHTGAYGIATACTGLCGCSFFEPNLPDTEPAVPVEVDYRSLYGMGLPVSGMDLAEAYAEARS